MSILFHDRVRAGRGLAQWLTKYRKQPDVLVLALPRGGVPVAAEIASELHAPLDITVVRKLGTLDKEEQRVKAYRGDRARPQVEGKRVILVDDGVVTGATIRAAIASVRSEAPRKLIIAVPVAPFQSLVQLRREADEVVCLATPEPLRSVGSYYESYPQLSDGDVRRVLCERWAKQGSVFGLQRVTSGGSDSASD